MEIFVAHIIWFTICIVIYKIELKKSKQAIYKDYTNNIAYKDSELFNKYKLNDFIKLDINKKMELLKMLKNLSKNSSRFTKLSIEEIKGLCYDNHIYDKIKHEILKMIKSEKLFKKPIEKKENSVIFDLNPLKDYKKELEIIQIVKKEIPELKIFKKEF